MPAQSRYSYHEPHGNPCELCGLTRARHRVRHAPGCKCGAAHKGSRSPSDAARNRTRTRAARRFVVGLDGEGAGRRPHKYTLLAWSDQSGEASAWLEDTDGLDTARCLEFLLTIPAAARVFGYYLGYDWTMILADLPDADIYRLFRPGLRRRPRDEGGGFSPVLWRGYALHYLSGMVRVSRRGRSVTVWDVGRFYQSTFVDAIDGAGLGIDTADIAKMKAKRSGFRKRDAPTVRAYCLTECRALAALVAQLNEAHESAGIPLKSWYGPGSSASVLLDQMGIRDKRGETPPELAEAARRAFFGGRFEHRAIGTFPGPIFGADIVSAYPAECLRLPCLEHAVWEWSDDESDILGAEQACVRWELAGSRSRRVWGPLPCRMRDGAIVYPRSGAFGWCWRDEWLVARRWKQLRTHGAWILRRACKCQPFARIQEVFEERLRVGKATAVGGALKRAYNSGYGKLAQRSEGAPFHCQVWAGMITSGTRAKLADIAWRYDVDLLAVATDGAYLRTRPSVREGPNLGEWEVEEYDSITLIRPGIYWTEKDVRSRGIPRKSVSAERGTILTALESGASGCELPPVTQFGAARAGVYRTPSGLKRSPRYGQWYERPVNISFAAGPKRQPDWTLFDLPGVESFPYRGADGAEALALKIAELLGEPML